jgi:hypothetical protein
MKKFALIAVALCVAFMMAAPAGALEITTDGYYRAQYLGSWNVKMADNGTDASTRANSAYSYGTMRLRVNNVIKVNDNLMIRTRFRAMNTRWGQDPDSNANFDWERAWMVARFDFGIMEVGRMQGGTWGTAFGDTEIDADRVKFTVPMGPVTLLAIYQKSAERDDQFETADTDLDVFYLAGVWKAENMSAGLLGAYVAGKTNSDLAPWGTALNKNARSTASTYSLLPFFTGKFGPFGLQAEGRWNFGKAVEWVDNVPGRKDRDSTGWAINVEGNYDFGMGNAQLGYAYVTGQERPNSSGNFDSTQGNIGSDWCKMLIMTGDTVPATNGGALGGYGSWGNGGNPDGISLIYGGADFKPMENLTLGFMVGYGTADETDRRQDDSIGWEFDFKAAYTIFDNLSNTLQVGYLDGGDYFKGSKDDPNYQARSRDFDSGVWAVVNEIKLSF